MPLKKLKPKPKVNTKTVVKPKKPYTPAQGVVRG
jgi:hypothetical protein